MGILYGIISALTYGLIPSFTLPLLAAHIPVETALVYRFGIATAVIGAILAFNGENFAIGRKAFGKIGLVSLFYTAAVLFYFYALELLPSGVVATLQFLFPVMVMLIMVFFFHERFHWQTALASCMAVAGVALLSLGEQNSSSAAESLLTSHVFLGVVLSLLAGLGNGLYFIAIKVANLPKLNGLLMTFYVMFFGTVCFFINAIVTNTLVWIGTWREFFTALLLAVVTAVISNLTLILAIRSIGPTFTSILAVGEPLTAVAAGICVFGEPFTSHLAFGVLLIASSVILAMLIPGRANG